MFFENIFPKVFVLLGIVRYLIARSLPLFKVVFLKVCHCCTESMAFELLDKIRIRNGNPTDAMKGLKYILSELYLHMMETS